MFFVFLNALFCIAFAAFAYVNLNDRDAWLWITIYMLASVSCGFAVFEKYFPNVYLILICFYILYAVKLFFDKNGVLDWITKYKQESIVQSMQATKPYIEKTREFFGLLIISAALAMNYFVAI